MYKNPTMAKNSQAFGDISIIRLAPNDQQIIVEYTCNNTNAGKGYVNAFIYDSDNNIVRKTACPLAPATIVIKELQNKKDYVMELVKYDDLDNIISRSQSRLFRTGYVPGTVVNYIHPDDYTYMPSGRSTASPCILRLPNGELLASHDVFWYDCEQNLTLVFKSDDNGKTWSYLSQVFPSFWTKIFYFKGAVYAFGTDGEYGDMNIFKSIDNGKTWSAPTLMCKGGNRARGGCHKAPMPVVEYKGRLWTAFEYGTWEIPTKHDAGHASIDVNDDLMVSENWTISKFLTYSNDWDGVSKGSSQGYLEGNIVITPENKLVDFLRYQTRQCQPKYGRAIILDIDVENPGKAPTFNKTVKFHGNFVKFDIRYDEKSEYYYSIVNRITQKQNLRQRNCISLTRSKTLDDWEVVKDIINYQDNGYEEDMTKVGFQYIDFLIEGDDIIFLSRTAINNSYDFHNANHLTFHTLKNFRDYNDI